MVNTDLLANKLAEIEKLLKIINEVKSEDMFDNRDTKEYETYFASLINTKYNLKEMINEVSKELELITLI